MYILMAMSESPAVKATHTQIDRLLVGHRAEGLADHWRASMAMVVENECVLMHAGGSISLEKRSLSTQDMENGSVLIRTLLGEVCGTDVHLFHGRLDTVPYPIIPGHVAVGRVHTLHGSIRDVDGSLVNSLVLPPEQILGSIFSCSYGCILYKRVGKVCINETHASEESGLLF